jgi:hypothetical protein
MNQCNQEKYVSSISARLSRRRDLRLFRWMILRYGTLPCPIVGEPRTANISSNYKNVRYRCSPVFLDSCYWQDGPDSWDTSGQMAFVLIKRMWPKKNSRFRSWSKCIPKLLGFMYGWELLLEGWTKPWTKPSGRCQRYLMHFPNCLNLSNLNLAKALENLVFPRGSQASWLSYA